MAQIRIERPDVVIYPALVECRAYVYDLKPDEYIDYFWSVSRPEIIEEIIHTNYTGRYVFRIFNDSNMDINLTAIVYKYDMEFNKVTIETLTETVRLYDDTLWAPYRYDALPRADDYDSQYEYDNEIVVEPLDFRVWQPENGIFELPYYTPVIVYANGGIGPYTYSWEIDAMGYEEAPPHSMFYRDNICSLVFPRSGLYTLLVTVTDSRNVSITKEVEIRALSEEHISSYKFDVPPRASHYDGYFLKIHTWSPPKFIMMKNNNYYVGKYHIKFHLENSTLSMNDILAQVKAIVNKTISPDQMWDRYYASEGFSFYAKSSRAAVYYGGRTTLQSIYLDKDDFVCFNLRLTSDYPISSAISRTLQAFSWVITMNDLDYEIVDIDRKYEFKPTAHSDIVLNGMKEYLADLVATKYARVELDERYEAIQTDIDIYLSKSHKYEYNGSIGYPTID